MKEKWENIGEVGVDSGQLLICDPCYIGSEWKNEGFKEEIIATHPNGKTEKLKRCSRRWFKLIDEINAGTIKIEEKTVADYNFSYASCCKASGEDNQLNYKLGHPGVGVVFSSGYGDGCYQVFAKKEKGRIKEIKIKFF